MTAPKRPSTGALFGAAVAAWLAAVIAEQVSWTLYAGEVSVSWCAPVLAAAIAAGALVVMWRRRRAPGSGSSSWFKRSACVFIVAFAASACCSGAYWGAWAHGVVACQQALEQGELACTLTSDASARDYGRVSTATCTAGGQEVQVRILWPEGGEPLSAGHVVEVSGSLSAPDADEAGRWNHQQGFVGMIAADEVEAAGYASGLRGLVAPFRDACFARIEAFGGEPAGLLAGVLLGNETLYEGSELEKDFQTTGLAHLMAVSGSHLAVVTALLGWLLGRLSLRRGARIAFTGVCLVLYVGLTCMAPSAVRSCAMCLVALCAGMARRRRHVATALALCVVVFLGFAPNLAFSVGFQLSVLAVAGLALLSPLLEAWAAWALPRRLEKIAAPLAATFAATMTTLPLTAPLFAQLPLISPVANVLVGPLITVVLGLGIPALVLAVLCPPAGQLLLSAAAALVSATGALVHALADVPGACVPLDAAAPVLGVLFGGAFVVLWAAWPLPPGVDEALAATPGGHALASPLSRKVLLTACLGVPVFIALCFGLGGASTVLAGIDPRAQSAAQLVMIDVGQGDCLLVRDGDASVLVDTGADDTLLVQGLARCGVTYLDAVVITHADDDHCGALSALAGVVGVEHVFVHEDLTGDPVMADVAQSTRWVTAGKGLEGIGVGSCIGVGHFTLTVLAPEDGGESDNEDSLVSLLEYDAQGDGVPEASGLLTGDAESAATEGLVKDVGDIDVLKVAHHGSRKSATPEELAVLKPEIALIGVGADNRYGHPTREMLNALSACHAKVYRTDLNGDIALGFSEDGIRVTVQRLGQHG